MSVYKLTGVLWLCDGVVVTVFNYCVFVMFFIYLQVVISLGRALLSAGFTPIPVARALTEHGGTSSFVIRYLLEHNVNMDDSKVTLNEDEYKDAEQQATFVILTRALSAYQQSAAAKPMVLRANAQVL